MKKPRPQSFYIRTFGCQMNSLDSEVMVGMLLKEGYVQTEEEAEADLIICNTCSIRDLAERKVMGKLGQLGREKRPSRLIAVTGCMANAKKEKFFQKFAHVDLVVGTNNIHELPEAINQVVESGEPALRVDETFSHEPDYTQAARQDKHHAHVSIIRGCNKRCTFCIVPYTRGPEVSRPPDAIVEECRALVQQGYQEITLLGQNVNSYGKDQPEWQCRFHDLLYRLDKIPGMRRLRFLTSHPVDITQELMEAIRDLDSVCEHVHFPMQAGSDRILRKMHRIYTKQEYLSKVALLREIVPKVALGTDMIVGFPTETEEEFRETYEAMQQVRYATAFLYTYSPRKGTPARRWVDDIPEAVKRERHQQLLALYKKISIELMEELIGQEMEVFVGRQSKDLRYLQGTTRCWRPILFIGDKELIGSIQTVRVESVNQQMLMGRLQVARQPDCASA